MDTLLTDTYGPLSLEQSSVIHSQPSIYDRTLINTPSVIEQGNPSLSPSLLDFSSAGKEGALPARATRRRWRPPPSPPPPSSRLFQPRTIVSKYPFEPLCAVSPLQPPQLLRAPLRRRGSAGASWSGTGSTPMTSRTTRRRTQEFVRMLFGFVLVNCLADWRDLSGAFFFFTFSGREEEG